MVPFMRWRRPGKKWLGEIKKRRETNSPIKKRANALARVAQFQSEGHI